VKLGGRIEKSEQVITAVPLLAKLMMVCPLLKLLVTSREALRLREEHIYVVPSLDLPDLKQLPAKERSHNKTVELLVV